MRYPKRLMVIRRTGGLELKVVFADGYAAPLRFRDLHGIVRP